MSIQFDIGELRTFILLAERGHFTETAQALGISQPAVSQRIARLENTFGLMLFTRAAERAVLTPCGQKLLDSARRCVESHDAMARRLSQQQAPRTNRVRIWIDRSYAGSQLSVALQEWDPDGSRVERVDAAKGADWAAELRNSEYDLALCGGFLQPEVPHGLNRIDLHREAGLSAVWAPAYHRVEAETFTLGELIDRPVLIPSERLVPGFRTFVEDWCSRAHGRPPAEIIEYDNCVDGMRACRAGRGIRLVPGAFTARIDPSDAALETRFLFGEVLPQAFIYGLHLRAGEKHAAVMETASWLIAAHKRLHAKPPAGAATGAAPKAPPL